MHQFKSGTYRQRDAYKSFSPTLINRNFQIQDDEIHFLDACASRFLGELNAYSKLIPDVDFFIQMHVTKEATNSNKIEGTQTTFDEAIMDKNFIPPERRDDWEEVRNYTKAMNYAIKRLESLTLSMRLINEAHSILLAGVRGKEKHPGEIRNSQNWIGGSSPTNARFVPPHKDELPELLTDLEKFIHNDSMHISPLVKAAIGHYQFETIHPYLDGNGRIGRLLITLFLINKEILAKPTLYLSDFFARNQNQYYSAISAVQQKNNLAEWVKFFLQGIAETARNSCETFDKIIKLRSHCESEISKLGKRTALGRELLQLLFSHPILDAKHVCKELEITHPTANSLLKKFVEFKLLGVFNTGKNRVYAFAEYIDIFKT